MAVPNPFRPSYIAPTRLFEDGPGFRESGVRPHSGVLPPRKLHPKAAYFIERARRIRELERGLK
jgi:hypothetical protein